MKKESKIVFIHSLNNYTGSPNVLSVVIGGLLKKGYSAELITSRGDGFLSHIEPLKYRYTCYRWLDNKGVTMLLLLLSQLGLFFQIIAMPRRNMYYINTIIPFGAILACKLTRKQFVIHVHENMMQRKLIYFICRTVYRICNNKSIFVSDYLKSMALNCRDGVVIHNSLPEAFGAIAKAYLKNKTTDSNSILMVSSLRKFKGVYEFAELAKRMPKYQFELVLSADDAEVEQFRSEIGVLNNLAIYSKQTNLHPFYQRAKLLLQLSHPESCVETFGLTILEAMTYGVASIVPNAGGPTELVEDGINGYAVNPHDIDLIVSKIDKLMLDKELYEQFCQAAHKKSTQFSTTQMIDSIESYINN